MGNRRRADATSISGPILWLQGILTCLRVESYSGLELKGHAALGEQLEILYEALE